MIGDIAEPESGPVFGEIYPGDATVLGDPSHDIAYRWVRDGNFKWIVPHQRGGQVWGNYGDHVQLYNLASDPQERVNLADTPKHRERVEQMTKLLDRWWLPNDDHDSGEQDE